MRAGEQRARFVGPRVDRAGWTLKAPGWWQRGDEIIFRRRTGVWFWYPDGFGKRVVGPFMSMTGARRRATRRAR